ncbi:MAG: monovalent cation/H(+) antiporter subunit G [Clostridiales bacterium]|nr:monovalent cation/H(+) antiporter subunit G [Candidatus Crickella equi]
MTATSVIAIILGLAGLAFMVISFYGIWTFPDFFARLHAQGVGDTLGALLLFLAMMVATGFKLLSLKIFLLFFVIMLTNPLGTNLIMMAQIHREDYQDYEKTEEEILNKEN